MGIRIQNKDVASVTAYGKVVSAIYTGGKLVWQAVRSCFGAGFWSNNKPWVNKEGWKN